MRLFFLALLTCLFVNYTRSQTKPFAPPFKNDLTVIDGSLTAKYLPSSKGILTYAAYKMDVNDFLNATRALQREILKQHQNQADAPMQRLIESDISYYIKFLINDYRLYYGRDSIGYEDLSRVEDEDPKGPSYEERIKKARKRAFTKKMDKSTRDLLNDLVFGNADPNNAALFARSALYRQWLEDYIERETYKYFEDDPILGYDGEDLTIIKGIKKEVSNPNLRDFLYFERASNAIKKIKNDSVVNTVYLDFKKEVNNKYYQARLDTIYENYLFLSNSVSYVPDFYFNDLNGKKVSISAFKGKYIYIDVWATWCEPCKKELPFLKVLEERYRDKDIVFMSISLDKRADTERWKKFVMENGLQGVQLIASNDFKSDFAKKFNINSIPRFILIAPDRKLLSGDAERPSDKMLTKYLDSLLKIDK